MVDALHLKHGVTPEYRRNREAQARRSRMSTSPSSFGCGAGVSEMEMVHLDRIPTRHHPKACKALHPVQPIVRPRDRDAAYGHDPRVAG